MKKLSMKEIFEKKEEVVRGLKEKTTITISKNLMDDLRTLSWYRESNNSDVVEEALRMYFEKKADEIKRAKDVKSKK